MNTDKNTFKYRIGNTVYIVGLKSAETAKEEYDTKLRKMITKEALSPSFSESIDKNIQQTRNGIE